MIDLYYWPTPNGHKISIMLEECELEYNTIPVNISQGDQFKPKFLRLSPNNRMPAIVDHDTGGLGPMAGQLSHFVNYAGEPQPYAHERYYNEYDRLLAVMDVRLRKREYLAGEFSIADIASFPWVVPYRRLGNDLDRFVNLRRWFDALKERPAVRTGMDLGKDWRRDEVRDDAARRLVFGQSSRSVFEAAKALED